MTKLYHFSSSSVRCDVLRTVPTIVTAHIFCACQGSRAQRERNAIAPDMIYLSHIVIIWEKILPLWAPSLSRARLEYCKYTLPDQVLHQQRSPICSEDRIILKPKKHLKTVSLLFPG